MRSLRLEMQTEVVPPAAQACRVLAAAVGNEVERVGRGRASSDIMVSSMPGARPRQEAHECSASSRAWPAVRGDGPGCSVAPGRAFASPVPEGPSRCCYGAVRASTTTPVLPRRTMTSCLLLTSTASEVPALSADLESAGIHIIGAVQRSNLVQEAVRLAPDVVVCHDASPDAAFFDTAALLLATSPR